MEGGSRISFDVEKFIEEVQKRPLLWDTTMKGYNDKFRKEDCWTELASVMFPNLPEKDFEKRGVLLSKKWKNIKDSYRKVQKQLEDGKVTKTRTYAYTSKLKFLNSTFCTSRKNTSRDEAESDSTGEQEDNNVDDSVCGKMAFANVDDSVCEKMAFAAVEPMMCFPENKRPASPDSATRKRLLEESMISYLQAQRRVCPPDDDQSFFESILPAVRQFDVDQKFEFRIKVMSIIKEMRKNNASSETSPKDEAKF